MSAGVLGQTEMQGGIVGTAPHLEGRTVDELALERASLADEALHQHANGHTRRECMRVDDQIRPAQQIAHPQISESIPVESGGFTMCQSV